MTDKERRIELLEEGQIRQEKILRQQTQILTRLETILENNTITLEEHQKRSLANERRLDILEKSDARHKAFVKGATWILGSLGGSAGVVWVVMNIVDMLAKR